MSKLKVFLCGFHGVGVQVLEHIIQRTDVDEVAVFTHESPSFIPDIRRTAAQNNIWCTTESINKLKWPFQPDIISSVYYRDIVRPHVIESVTGRIFNLHPSLLPRHRGCSSVAWAISDGDPLTGITFHYIDSGVDTGRILLQLAIEISNSETQASLFQRCMDIGAAFWPAAFELVKVGFQGFEQHGEPTMHRRGPPYDGKIDDSWPLDKICRFVRAMTHPPYPYATYRGEEIKTVEDFLRLRRLK